MKPARVALDIARVHDLELYLQNEPKARRRLDALFRVFGGEMGSGDFSVSHALLRMQILVDNAAKSYGMDYGDEFPHVVRTEAAKSLVRMWMESQ